MEAGSPESPESRTGIHQILFRGYTGTDMLKGSACSIGAMTLTRSVVACSRSKMVRGRIGAVGPSSVQPNAAPCRPLQGTRRKQAWSFSSPTVFEPEGRGNHGHLG